MPVIAYDVAGQGPPVAFIHGLASYRQMWAPVTDLLTSEVTCVRVDLLGHGESGPAADYSMLAQVAAVHEVVERLGLGQPTLVGHSLGANVAAVYAAAHGSHAVICVDPPSLRFGDFAELIAPYADELRSDRTMEAVVAIDHALGLEPYAGIAEMERRILAFPREVVLGLWEAALTTPPDQLTAVAEAVLPRITAPLLSLHGAAPPADYEAWLTKLVPKARVETWAGLGHMLHLVDPERLAARVRDVVGQGGRTRDTGG